MNSTDSPKRGPIFKITVIAVFILLFSVVMVLCMEGFIRFYYSDILSTADGKSYFSVKSHHLFREELNDWRFRGKHFNQTPDERYRLVVTGDSFTYGQGVYPAEKRFTERIDSLLNEQSDSSDVEVTNAGICGFNLANHFKFLHFIDAIQPDYVLYQWYVNDMMRSSEPSKYASSHLIKNLDVHTWLWQHSALYYLLQRWYGSWQIGTGSTESYQQYLINNLSDPSGKPAIYARETLGKLIDHHKKNNTDFGIVLFPSFYGPMDQYKLGFLHEQVLAVCGEKEIECLDLRSDYSDVEHKKLWANAFDPHPSALAHEIAAGAIYDFFGSTWKAAAREKDSINTSEKKQ